MSRSCWLILAKGLGSVMFTHTRNTLATGLRDIRLHLEGYTDRLIEPLRVSLPDTEGNLRMPELIEVAVQCKSFAGFIFQFWEGSICKVFPGFHLFVSACLKQPGTGAFNWPAQIILSGT